MSGEEFGESFEWRAWNFDQIKRNSDVVVS